MNKSTNNTKCSAVFLATLLVAGIIALSSPSFMTGAQAVPYSYGMDNFQHKPYGDDNFMNSYGKTYGKETSVKYIKCNNININVNGLEIEKNRPQTGVAEAQAQDQIGANAFRDGGSGGDSGFYKKFDKDVVFVCINHNNNGNNGKDGQIPKTCAGCFKKLSRDDFNLLNEYLKANPTEIGTVKNINSIEALCAALVTVSATEPVDADFVLNLFIVAGLSQDVADDLIDCLNNLGLVDEPSP